MSNDDLFPNGIYIRIGRAAGSPGKPRVDIYEGVGDITGRLIHSVARGSFFMNEENPGTYKPYDRSLSDTVAELVKKIQEETNRK